MAHHKRRKRKAYKGCCGMCACKDYHGGVRNKRNRTVQERKAAESAKDQGVYVPPSDLRKW